MPNPRESSTPSWQRALVSAAGLAAAAISAFAQPAQPAAPAAAPEPAPLTLQAAMSLARAQAPEVAAAASRATAAGERAAQAGSSRWPQLRLSETWLRTDSPADVFGLKLSEERFSFPDFVASDPNRPPALAVGLTRLELEMPLWTGGEIGGRIRQAAATAAGASADAAWAANQAALAAAEAWLDLAEAREAGAVLGRAREAVAAHLETARALAEQGLLVRSEVLRAEVELAKVEDQCAEASARERLAEESLAYRLGAPPSTRYALGALPWPPEIGDAPDPWIAGAAERPDVSAARQRLRASRLEVAVQQAARWPRVALAARYDLADDHLFGDHGRSSTVLARASLDLFTGGRRRAAIAAAAAEAEAARRDTDRLAEGAALAVRQAWEQAATARGRRETARRALGAAAEAWRISEERFAAGVVKTIDVLDAATAKREAEMREVTARAAADRLALRLAVAAGRRPEDGASGAAPPSAAALGGER